MRQIFIRFYTIILLTNSLAAQSNTPKQSGGITPFVLGIVEQIKSIELGESRTLNIYLPEGYSPDSAATYPVIYLLDGSANEDFIHITGIVQFLVMIGAMPRSIIIGIANVDRRRDFTFPTTNLKDKKSYPTTGSSEKFIAFIEKELQPFVEQKFKTNNIKTIIGQSLGGLLATEVLLKKPYLFNQYFIVSPSLWWNDESLLRAAPGLLQKQSDANIKVYLSVGNEEKQMEDDAKRLAGILKNSGKKNLHIDYVPLRHEDHLTILHNSVYKGFELMYPQKATTTN